MGVRNIKCHTCLASMDWAERKGAFGIIANAPFEDIRRIAKLPHCRKCAKKMVKARNRLEYNSDYFVIPDDKPYPNPRDKIGFEWMLWYVKHGIKADLPKPDQTSTEGAAPAAPSSP